MTAALKNFPRTFAELDEPALREDRARRVPGARVAWMDEALLAADFPWIGPSRAAVESWLLRHAAVVSATQAAQAVVNTPIPTEGAPFPACRLPRGGRAFFVEVADSAGEKGKGLLALKGIGVAPGKTPSNAESHSDGLFPLHEALKEVLSQRIVEAVLYHAGRGLRALPVYAVLDLGFDILDANGGRWPASVLARRAHRRPPDGRDLPLLGSREQDLCLDMELLLRRYGVTSVTEGTTRRMTCEPGEKYIVYYYQRSTMKRGYFPQESARSLWKAYAPAGDPLETCLCFEGINIQTTRGGSPEEAELVDFGSYRVRPRFEWPLLSLVHEKMNNWGGLVPPNSSHYAQPDPRLALPARYWEEAEGRPAPVDRLCLRAARAIRAGRLSSEAVENLLARWVERITAHWPAAGAA